MTTLNKCNRHKILPLLAALILCPPMLSRALAATVAPELPATPAFHIRHPYNVASDKIYAKRTRYVVALLDLAMSKSGEPYTLEAVPLETVTANRNTRNLMSDHYNINWIHTNAQREKNLLPIRIPLFKGLIGWRLMLIRKDRQDAFAQLNSLNELKLLTAGQGHDWPDTTILKHHNFNVITSTSRESLINMVMGKRIDYFPRSIMEIFEEWDIHQTENLAIEQHIAMVYPTAYYFFVTRENTRLAQVLERGLNAALADGSFDALLSKYYQPSIELAHLNKRKIFYVSNPMLTPETPLQRKELWFSPAQ